VGSYLGIYFYLRLIQVLFMSTATKTQTAPSGVHTPQPVAFGGLARGASLICLAAMVLLAIVPGWVLERL
jgi:NADH-quinone oxidoreductase subunit N